MSKLGEEYVTEFGEFLDFESNRTDSRTYKEPVHGFQNIDDIPLDVSPNFQKIVDIVEQYKASTTK